MKSSSYASLTLTVPVLYIIMYSEKMINHYIWSTILQSKALFYYKHFIRHLKNLNKCYMQEIIIDGIYCYLFENVFNAIIKKENDF